MESRLKRRILFCAGLLALGIIFLAARPIYHLGKTRWNDRNALVESSSGTMNDASRLDETPVKEIWKIPTDKIAAEMQLAELLERARTNHLKISVAGARHSMGGHVIARDGIVIDMLPFHRMELDEGKRILRVEAGARWREVIPFLNQRGLSVEIMQSNDDFSVGGSLSVNCHGWQFGRPPIASSVESFRLMLADGTLVRCSRSENSELFSLVLGGYGLFGIILEADLHVTPNERYKIERVTIPVPDYTKVLARKTAKPSEIALVYGRLNVSSANFLEEGMLNIFRRTPAPNFLVTPLAEMKNAGLQRAIFRGGVGDDYGKRLRWDAEKYFSSAFSGDVFERNAILHVPSTWFQDRSKETTDVLVECFVPPQEFERFVADLRKIIPKNEMDLLNVTVREVHPDHDSFLRYADREMISLVMFFNQRRDAAGEERMKKATQEIIAAALAHDGSYYLPYRLHAAREQFQKAYPQAQQFFALKRKYDPAERFENEFYRTYDK